MYLMCVVIYVLFSNWIKNKKHHLSVFDVCVCDNVITQSHAAKTSLYPIFNSKHALLSTELFQIITICVCVYDNVIASVAVFLFVLACCARSWRDNEAIATNSIVSYKLWAMSIIIIIKHFQAGITLVFVMHSASKEPFHSNQFPIKVIQNVPPPISVCPRLFWTSGPNLCNFRRIYKQRMIYEISYATKPSSKLCGNRSDCKQSSQMMVRGQCSFPPFFLEFKQLSSILKQKFYFFGVRIFPFFAKQIYTPPNCGLKDLFDRSKKHTLTNKTNLNDQILRLGNVIGFINDLRRIRANNNNNNFFRCFSLYYYAAHNTTQR